MLLKPNMVISGESATNRASAELVGEKTITCFKRVVPAAVPGIVFLSGGQGDDEAIDNLNAINGVAMKRYREVYLDLMLITTYKFSNSKK
mgnify:CR=1 FL=1